LQRVASAAAGSSSKSGCRYTVKGSGADVYGTTDEFRYVYRPGSPRLRQRHHHRARRLQREQARLVEGLMMREGTTTINVGMAVASHADRQVAAGVFDQVTITQP
jgi:hypothetical protein